MVFVGVLFYFSIASASTITELENYEIACIEGSTVSMPCTHTGGFGNNYVSQKFAIPTVSSGSVTIDSISIDGDDKSGSVGPDQKWWVSFENNLGFEIASTTVVSGTDHLINGWATYTFNPSFVITSSTASTGYPSYFKLKQSCSGTCGTKSWQVNMTNWIYGGPYTGYFSSTTIGYFPHLFPATTDGTERTEGQIIFKLEATEQGDLSITYPDPLHAHYGNTMGSVVVTGVCPANVDLTFSNGAIFQETYQEWIIQDITCSAGTYSYDAGAMPYDGTWDLHASSTGGTEYDVAFNFFGTAPYEVSDVADMGGLIGEWFKNYRDLRPYSYAIDFWNIFTSVFNASSTSTTLPSASFTVATSVSPYMSGTYDIFTPSAFYGLLDQSAWDSLRPYMNLVLYFVFALYFYRRIHKLFQVGLSI